MQKAGKKIGTKRNKISIKRIWEGGIMKDIIKKSWTTGYYMIYPKVQQKEKKQNI